MIGTVSALLLKFVEDMRTQHLRVHFVPGNLLLWFDFDFLCLSDAGLWCNKLLEPLCSRQLKNGNIPEPYA